jgi:hypothetical protein
MGQEGKRANGTMTRRTWLGLDQSDSNDVLLVRCRKKVRASVVGRVEKIPQVDRVGADSPRQLGTVVRPQAHLEIARRGKIRQESGHGDTSLVLEHGMIGIVVAIRIVVIGRTGHRRAAAAARKVVQMAGRVVTGVDPILQRLLVASHGFRQQATRVLEAGKVVAPEFAKVFGHGGGCCWLCSVYSTMDRLGQEDRGGERSKLAQHWRQSGRPMMVRRRMPIFFGMLRGCKSPKVSSRS